MGLVSLPFGENRAPRAQGGWAPKVCGITCRVSYLGLQVSGFWYVSYSLNSLRGLSREVLYGYIGVVKGDTRSLDYGPCGISATGGSFVMVSGHELHPVLRFR